MPVAYAPHISYPGRGKQSSLPLEEVPEKVVIQISYVATSQFSSAISRDHNSLLNLPTRVIPTGRPLISWLRLVTKCGEHIRNLRASGSMRLAELETKSPQCGAEKGPRPIRDPLQAILLHLELLDCSRRCQKMAMCKPLYHLAEHGQFTRSAHGSLTISCAGMREGEPRP
jgi:hypothetical protein